MRFLTLLLGLVHFCTLGFAQDSSEPRDGDVKVSREPVVSVEDGENAPRRVIRQRVDSKEVILSRGDNRNPLVVDERPPLVIGKPVAIYKKTELPLSIAGFGLGKGSRFTLLDAQGDWIRVQGKDRSAWINTNDFIIIQELE
ncbi:MAG: hypothetical protein AAFX93_09470 [Verrucomicrobiota bacterium]